MRFTWAKRFKKQFDTFPLSVRTKVIERLRIFVEDPYSPILENHKLSGEFSGFRSINITGDYRAIYEEIAPDIVRFVLIGTHHELYGK